jgi:hypothetical protein
MATGTIPNTPLSSVSLFNSNTPFYAPNLPVGIANNLGWTAGPSGDGFASYVSSITVKGVKSTSALSVSMQTTSSYVHDAVYCWLISAYPTANTINFIVAGNPENPANFPISWAVTKL